MKDNFKVGDMVVVNHSTDFLQAMARKDTGIILEIREVKPHNGMEMLIAWADGDIRWMRGESDILKVISRAS